LALQLLKGITTGEDVFETVITQSSRESGLTGVHYLVGAWKGLIGIVHERTIELQIQPENLANFHCIIHQQNLCAKSIKFTNVMEVVVASINFIKSRALNHHQFKEYLADLFLDYEDVLLL
jgi:hypothetical protein